MPEIDDALNIDLSTECIQSTVTANGDIITISGLNLTNGQAATLAWLVSHGAELHLELKIKE